MNELAEKKLFLLDMDGTIYLDEYLFDGTLDFLARVKERGGRYLFLTNNSSKSVDKYVEKLARLGIEAVPEDFLTSTQATIGYLKKNYPADTLYYASGTASFRQQLADAGLRVTDHLEDGISVLVEGFDTELTFQKLEDDCILLGRGVDFIATNPDWVCPTAYGYVPDCGSVSEMLFRATGRRPRFIGKPEPTMVQLALEATGFAAGQAMMIGDRVYTDIASGYNAGIDTALVLSGEATMKDVEASDIKPTFIYQNIREICTRLEENV